MDLPKYTGTIHPEEWLRQIKTFCYIKQITNEQEILKICTLMIDPAIIILDEINSFDELIKALKLHSTFNIFKDSCKRKLQVMKFIPKQEKNYTATFLSDFRSLCYDAEINDPEEIKNFLMNSYSYEFFNTEFTKSVTGINSIDEILKKFSDIVFEELKIIKSGSLIALKHIATGRYLSSCEISYQSGSRGQLVFAGKTFQNINALWVVRSKFHGTISYGDMIRLTHKATDQKLLLSNKFYSPTTKYAEVSCCGSYSSFNCINTNPTNNDTPFVKTNDVINLETSDDFLRSHDNTFSIGGTTFQEVVGHNNEDNEEIDGNDEWQIELAEEYKDLK